MIYPTEEKHVKSLFGRRNVTMRNPHQSDAFLLCRRVVNLFQELKPKRSHRDFEKSEAAEHN